MGAADGLAQPSGRMAATRLDGTGRSVKMRNGSRAASPHGSLAKHQHDRRLGDDRDDDDQQRDDQRDACARSRATRAQAGDVDGIPAGDVVALHVTARRSRRGTSVISGSSMLAAP